MLKTRRQTGMSSLAMPTTPKHKSTSKLAPPREESLRTSKSCTKVRPVPDFSKLHQKWQSKLDRAKSTSKKPTVPHEFDLTEVGSTGKQVDIDGGVQGSCDLVEPDLIQSLTSLADIQDVLADQKHRYNKKISSSPIGTPFSGKKRQILGKLGFAENSPSSDVTNGKRKAGHTDDMEFKCDPVALQSILMNKGITTEEFSSLQNSAVKRSTFLSPGRVLRPPNSIKMTPVQNPRQSIYCSMTDLRTSLRKPSKALESGYSISKLSRTCDQPRRVKIMRKETSASTFSAFPSPMGQLPIRNSIYISNKKSIRTPVQGSGNSCNQKKMSCFSTPDLLASPDVAKADLKSVKKRLHWADGLSPTQELDFTEDCLLATALDKENEDLPTVSKYQLGQNTRVDGKTMQTHLCVDKVETISEDVHKDIITGQADHCDGARVENTLHRLQQLELLEKQLVCDLKDIESDIIKENQTLSCPTSLAGINSNKYDANNNNNNGKSQNLKCSLSSVVEKVQISTADRENNEQSKCLSMVTSVIKPEECDSNINDCANITEDARKLFVNVAPSDTLCSENYNSKSEGSMSLSSHSKSRKKRRSIDDLNQTLYESQTYISELTQIEEELYSNQNNNNNNNNINDNVDYVNKVSCSTGKQSAKGSYNDGTVKRSDVEKQLELVQKQQQELVQVQNRLKALLVTERLENKQDGDQVADNISVSYDSPNVGQVLDHANISYYSQNVGQVLDHANISYYSQNVGQVPDNTKVSYGLASENHSFKSLTDGHRLNSARSGLRSSESVYCLTSNVGVNDNNNVKKNSLKTSKTVHNLVNNIEDSDTHFLLHNDLNIVDISTDKNGSDPSSSNVRLPLQIDVCALDNVLDLRRETHSQLSQETTLPPSSPSHSMLVTDNGESNPSKELPLFCARSAFSEYSSACNGNNSSSTNLYLAAREESSSAAAVTDTNISNSALLCRMRESLAAPTVVSHRSAERQTTLQSVNTSCLPQVESALTAAPPPGTSKRQNATTVETNHHHDRADCGKVFTGRENQESVINQFDNDQVCDVLIAEKCNDYGNIGDKYAFVETRFNSGDKTGININNKNNNIEIIFSKNNPVSLQDKFVENSDNLIGWLSATDRHGGIRPNTPVVSTSGHSYSTAFTHGNVCPQSVPMQEGHRETVWSGSDIPLDLTTNTCNNQRQGVSVNTGVSSEESFITGQHQDPYTSDQMSRSIIPTRLLSSSFSTPNLQALASSSFHRLNPVVNRRQYDIGSTATHSGASGRDPAQSVFAFPGQYHQQQRSSAIASNNLSHSRTGSISKSYVSSSVLPRLPESGGLSVIAKPMPVSFSSNSHLEQAPFAQTSSRSSLFSKVNSDFERKGVQQNWRSASSHVATLSGAFSRINQRSGSLNGQMSSLLLSSSPFIPSSRSDPSFDDELLDDECSWYNGSLVGQMGPSRCSNPVAAMLMAGDNQHFLPIHED